MKGKDEANDWRHRNKCTKIDKDKEEREKNKKTVVPLVDQI